MEKIEQPLVSIIVITYNSSKFVIETLDSVKSQTYQNIELIVSDDCSTDNTVEICRIWIEENKKRFVKTELITSEKNTGISANCNRGLKSANGEWIKFIAGDDVLTNNSIELLLNAAVELKCEIVFGNAIKIDSHGNLMGKVSTYEKIIDLKFSEVLYKNGVLAPATFIKHEILKELNGFNETLMFEDWDMWLRALNAGFSIKYIPSVVVYYRTHENNISKNILLSEEINILKKWKKNKHFNWAIIKFTYYVILKSQRKVGLFKAIKNSFKVIKIFPIALFIYFYPILYLRILKHILINDNSTSEKSEQ